MNSYLSSYGKGLTSRVFRTYNASVVFQEQLENTPIDASEEEKISVHNQAYCKVNKLLNHKRNASKLKTLDNQTKAKNKVKKQRFYF